MRIAKVKPDELINYRIVFLGLFAALLSGCVSHTELHHVGLEAHQAMTLSRQNRHAILAATRNKQVTDSRIDQQIKTLTRQINRLGGQFVQFEKSIKLHQRANRKLLEEYVQAQQSQTKPLSGGMTVKVENYLPQLIHKAHQLAQKPYKPLPKISKILTKMGYTTYQNINFHGQIPDWDADGKLKINFYPAGYLFRRSVNFFVLHQGKAIPLRYRKNDFNFPVHISKQIHDPVPLAGFSLYYPFHPLNGSNEFLSFLGASYFRAVGRGQSWGLSARGLAINTGIPGKNEQFPYFRAFWFCPPKPKANVLTFYALLDSPSLTGAYRFRVHPGTNTVIHVDVILFERKHVRRLGIAPLTSMFLQDGNGGKVFNTSVRAAHDSGGLSIHVQKRRWLWVPLRNPARLTLYRIPLQSIKGFGLMQRHRKYDEYQAWGMQYQKRPSAWITPLRGDWSHGHLVLLELPTHTQTNDNITAFWEPDKQPSPGKPMRFSYTINWEGKNQTLPHLGHVVRTRYVRHHDLYQYIINFSGATLRALPAWVHVKPVITISGPGKLVRTWVAKNEETHHWRLALKVKRTGQGVIHLHAQLKYGKKPLSEIWYIKRPD